MRAGWWICLPVFVVCARFADFGRIVTRERGGSETDVFMVKKETRL